MTFRNLRWALAPAVLAGSLLFFPAASASTFNTLLTGSIGTVTMSLSSILIFNPDPAAVGGGNSDVAAGTNLVFTGCASGVLGSPGCLSAAEGITVNNLDLTFAAHPNLVFSIVWPPGPGSANTNCATANANGLSCSVFAGEPIILTYLN